MKARYWLLLAALWWTVVLILWHVNGCSTGTPC